MSVHMQSVLVLFRSGYVGHCDSFYARIDLRTPEWDVGDGLEQWNQISKESKTVQLRYSLYFMISERVPSGGFHHARAPM
jgi:hypothetical protein